MSSTVEKRILGTARVRVLLEIDCTQPWGPDCPLSQLLKQAEDEARGMIRNKLPQSGVRIIGEPDVLSVVGRSQ